MEEKIKGYTQTSPPAVLYIYFCRVKRYVEDKLPEIIEINGTLYKRHHVLNKIYGMNDKQIEQSYQYYMDSNDEELYRTIIRKK